MMILTLASRHIRLSLSEFDVDPTEIRATLCTQNMLIQRKGDKTLTGRLIEQSTLIVPYGFDATITWGEALDALMESLGGINNVEHLLSFVNAKDQHIHFQLPVRGSPLQENNFLPIASLDLLRKLRLWVGFDFSTFDPDDPTHSGANHKHIS